MSEGFRVAPATDSTRGILSPAKMTEVVDFHRYPVPPALDGLVDWFWSVRWRLPPQTHHLQQLVALPGVNVSVGPAPPPGDAPPPGPYPVTVKINGVATELSSRRLTGAGWTVGAKISTGAFGAWYPRSVRDLTNRVLAVEEIWPVDGPAVAAGLAAAWAERPDDPAPASAGLGALLVDQLDRAAPDRIRAAHEVVAIAAIAESDREIRRVDELAAAAGLTVRTLQRTFGEFAGVSPKWIIRRFRLIEAAERARAGDAVDWASTAVELGYADQSHLTREFTATIGVAPAAYAARQG